MVKFFKNQTGIQTQDQVKEEKEIPEYSISNLLPNFFFHRTYWINAAQYDPWIIFLLLLFGFCPNTLNYTDF